MAGAVKSIRRSARRAEEFRIGKVKGYLRGRVWYLHYFEQGRRHRPRVGPSREIARQTAAQINGQLEVGVPAALSFEPIPISDLRERWLSHHEHVRRSSLQTINRYRTATEHLLRFLQQNSVRHASHFRVSHAEEFVRYLRNLRVAPNGHANSVKRPLLTERKRKIEADGKARNLLASAFPIRKREEAAKIITPVKRQPLEVSTPKPAAPNQPPSYTLETGAYDDILRTIDSMVRVFERSPETFRNMDEEDLRMILLVGLNGVFEGAATGETFNSEGKTDILIRHKDNNLFIAECLVWKGQNVLRSKMDDQLFRYATWRDSKLAILIFNRNKGFSDVIAKMKETAESHPQKLRTIPFQHQSGARYIFRRADDPQKEFMLTCLAFDVP